MRILRHLFCADDRLKAENIKLRSEVCRALDLIAQQRALIALLSKNDAQRSRDERGRFAR